MNLFIIVQTDNLANIFCATELFMRNIMTQSTLQLHTTRRNSFLMGLLFVLVSSLFTFTIPLSAFETEYLTLNTFSGPVGTELTVSGGGFTANHPLQIYLGGSSTSTKTISTDEHANFSTQIVVPITTGTGRLSVVAKSSSPNISAENFFYVVPFNPTATFNATSHTPLSTITVSGSGFAPRERINFELAGGTSYTVADQNGSFTDGEIIIPNVAEGLYHLNVAGSSSGASVPQWQNYFWIDKFYPSVSPSSYYLTPGSTLTFSGSGFSEHEVVSIYANGGSVPVAEFVTCSCEKFENRGEIVIPFSLQDTKATYELRGSQSGATTSTTVTIGKLYVSISPSSYYVTPNNDVVITGSGFAPGETVIVDIMKDGTRNHATSTADTNGSFSATLLVPFGDGLSPVSARGASSGEIATVNLTLARFYPSVTPSIYYLSLHSTVSFVGRGYAAREQVVISSPSFVTTSVTADASGSFVTEPITTISRSSSSTPVTLFGVLSQAEVIVNLALQI
ncbi:MAG: hypothetical protein Q7K40_04435 [bacterium]|nr:hypothetical protein [bacterium]